MSHVLQHDKLLRATLEETMLGKRTKVRRRTQLIDDLLEKKNYTRITQIQRKLPDADMYLYTEKTIQQL